MLGMVFNEFVDLAEDRFGPVVLERAIERSCPASGAAYTAYGIYDHGEMIAMVDGLSHETGIAPATLQTALGRHLFGALMRRHGDLAERFADPLTLLAGIEDVIHVAVRRIYPDAQLPRFDSRWEGADRLVLVYRSLRPFGALCHGLIEGCCAHFGVACEVEVDDRSGPEASHVIFTVTRRAAPA